MKKISVQGFVALAMLFSTVLLSFQNCTNKIEFASSTAESLAKAGGSGGTNGADGNTGDSTVPVYPPDCQNFASVKTPVKVIVLVDNSDAAEVADPAKALRLSILNDFVSRYATNANIEWSLLYFNDGTAHALINSGLESAPAFGNADGANSAIQQLKSIASSGKADYKPAFDLVSNAIKSDVDFQNDPQHANYVIVTLAGGAPTDFGSPLDPIALTLYAKSLSDLSLGHISMNTIDFGSADSLDAFTQIADTSGGKATLLNSANTLNQAQVLPEAYHLEVIAKVPAQLCQDTSPTATPAPGAVCISPTRDIFGGDFVKSEACGTSGKKDVTYAPKITEACTVMAGNITWTESSRTNIKKSEGPCQGQSCSLADGSLLADKASRTFYSSSAPTGSCSSSSVTRTCDNGTLSGSTSFNTLTCRSGCGAFGADGTKKTGVVIGQTDVPVTCQFGETGVTSTYQTLADQTCDDGQIKQSASRQGDLLKAGVCPTYSWTATDKWTTCSADCGGQQTKIYECRDDKGTVADASRCAGAAPIETRACDGNPAAVARQDVTKDQDEANSTTDTCPTNQIGIIVNVREVTTTKTYACVDHAVKLVDTKVDDGPWSEEKYCRDYVAHRCSQDSLNNDQAQGRYEWMVKCRAQVPVIEEFLTKFAGVKVVAPKTLTLVGIDSKGNRHVYPTFMNTASTPEKPWIAPTTASASCDTPTTAYVASVCLSSCATPEQQILAEVEASAKRRYMPFIDALTQNAKFVATLRTDSSMDSTNLRTTRVEQWVTEMLDTSHDIINFRLQSGRSLRLTPNHTVLAADGTMKLADDFKVGDSLVQVGGKLDPIVALDHEVYFGKVYNLFVKSADPKNNIVITNGYLNGTAFFQNEGAANVNRELFRDKLIKGVFDK